MINIEIYGGSDRGLIRKNNEDSIGYSLYDRASIALALVADGVGGYEGGEVASRIAADSIKEFVRKAVLQASSGGGYSDVWMEQVIINAIESSNREIINQQQLDKTIFNMATTIVALLIKDNRLVLAHVGDSRCYLFRDAQLTQLTKDHTVAQKMLDEGTITKEQYRSSPYHHVLSKAVGIEKIICADVIQNEIKEKDIYLLCSDGLTNCLTDMQILEILKSKNDIQECVEELIVRSNDEGGIDNISVVLVSCNL